MKEKILILFIVVTFAGCDNSSSNYVHPECGNCGSTAGSKPVRNFQLGNDVKKDYMNNPLLPTMVCKSCGKNPWFSSYTPKTSSGLAFFCDSLSRGCVRCRWSNGGMSDPFFPYKKFRIYPPLCLSKSSSYSITVELNPQFFKVFYKTFVH